MGGDRYPPQHTSQGKTSANIKPPLGHRARRTHADDRLADRTDIDRRDRIDELRQQRKTCGIKFGAIHARGDASRRCARQTLTGRLRGAPSTRIVQIGSNIFEKRVGRNRFIGRSSPNSRKSVVGPWRNKAIAPYEPSALSPLSPPGVNESYPGVKLPTALLFVFPAQAERTLARNFSASVFNLLLSTDSP